MQFSGQFPSNDGVICIETQKTAMVNESGVLTSFLNSHSNEDEKEKMPLNQQLCVDHHAHRQTTPTNNVSHTSRVESERIWKSCCITMDKSAVKYFFQVGVLGTIIGSAIAMLIIHPNCDEQRNWSAILMLCLGVFVPTPRM